MKYLWQKHKAQNLLPRNIREGVIRELEIRVNHWRIQWPFLRHTREGSASKKGNIIKKSSNCEGLGTSNGWSGAGAERAWTEWMWGQEDQEWKAQGLDFRRKVVDFWGSDGCRIKLSLGLCISVDCSFIIAEAWTPNFGVILDPSLSPSIPQSEKTGN